MARGQETSPWRFLCGGRSGIADSRCFRCTSSQLLHRCMVPLVAPWGLLRVSVLAGKATVGDQRWGWGTLGSSSITSTPTAPSLPSSDLQEHWYDAFQ